MSLFDWWRRRFPPPPPPPPPPPRRPRPADWNKTLDELMAEKRTISGEEIDWARSYERDQLRSWARFPRDGEVFEAPGDLEVDFITHWAAPYSGGGKGRLPAGSRIRVIVGAHEPEPILVYADPLDNGRFEQAWVPESKGRPSKYGGFHLCISVKCLNEDFRRVE